MGASQSPDPSLMSFTPPPNQLARRKKAAELLEAVIDEAVEPQIAINRWPDSPDCPDRSLDCAYLALWHFEADETQQKTEVFYLDAQLDLLRQMVSHLQAGRDLPPYILRMYLPAPAVKFYYPHSAWAASLSFVTGLWRQFKATGQLAIGLLKRT